MALKRKNREDLDFIQVANRLNELAIGLDAGSFSITHLHREDLLRYGTDVDKVTDEKMEEIASELGDYFTEYGGFWECLEGYADDLPKTLWGKLGYQRVDKKQAKLIFKQAKVIHIWAIDGKSGIGQVCRIPTKKSFEALCKEDNTVFLIECE